MQAQSPATRRQNTTFIHVTLISSSTPSSDFPRFSSTTTSFNVSASAPVGTTFGSVSATTLRRDVTRLVYDVVGGNVDDRFVVDSTSGQLRVRRPLSEYWRLPRTFELWVEARDDGRPSLSDAVAVTVSVSPVNVAAPRFEQDAYSATVVEKRRAPVDVLTVTAVDSDLGEAGRVTYSFSHDDSSVVFTIDETTGQIRTAAVTDRETAANYQLVVYASDHVSHDVCPTGALSSIHFGTVAMHSVM